VLRAASILVALSTYVTAARADEPTARDTDGAPLPGEESGRIDDTTTGPISTSRAIARGALFVPRLVVATVLAPVRGSLYLHDRYQIGPWYWRVFWNDDRTVGVIPLLGIDSGFGLNVGARFVANDQLGWGENITAQASTGGRFAQRYLARFRTAGPHDALGRPRLAFELGGEIEDRIREPFYGIGNSDPAIETRFREDARRARTGLGVRLAGDLYLRGAVQVSDLAYDGGEQGTSIEMVYDTSQLAGFDGVRDLYGEVELRYDSRRAVGPWDAPVLPATGWFASIYGGRDRQFGMLGDYWRYGADLQRFTRLGVGPRILIARLRGEAVSNDETAFSELPELGGVTLLRGYAPDRFRDRVSALGTLEYQWDLNRYVMANIFIDAGRVYSSLDELSFDNLRVGYGFGVALHFVTTYVGRAHIATSKDGGVFLHLAFDPVFVNRPREMRE
jgi:hypothetical protein